MLPFFAEFMGVFLFVYVIFATGKWPGIPLTKGGGDTLATTEINSQFEIH